MFTAGVFAQNDKDDIKNSERWSVDARVNLMVTDANGNPVDNISVGDIKLFENDVEQKVTYFAKSPVSNVAFVMDNTGSMRTQLNVITALGNVITNNLGANDEAMVVRFVSTDKVEIFQAWTGDKSQLKKTFDDMFIEGGKSAVVDAVYLAAKNLVEEAKTKKDKRFAMILITDGDDRDSYYRQKDIFSLILGTNIQIFAIGLTAELKNEASPGKPSEKERAERFLNTLTARTGGAAYLIGNKHKKEDLEAAVISLITELRSPFVIGYTSTNQKHDGGPRKLRVEIADGPAGEKRTAVVKNSFVVPK